MTSAAGAGTNPPVVVLHCGPDPRVAGGGIETVMRNYELIPWRRLAVRVAPSYRRGAALASLGPALSCSLRILGFRLRHGRRGVVHVHLSHQGSFLREGGLLAWGRLLGLRVHATLHGSGFEDFAQTRPALVRGVLGLPRSIGILSESTRETVTALVPSAVLVTVPNPVVSERTCGSLPAAPVALFAGQVSKRKGMDVLLEAWPGVVERVPSARLVVAGPPGDVPVPDVPSIEWLGSVSRAQVKTALCAARVAVLPSRGEQMPMFLMEAAVAARPIVSTTVGGIAQLVAEPEQLIAVGDVDALRQRLVALLSDPDLCRAEGEANRAKAVRRFGEPAVEARLLQLYGEANADAG